MRKYLDADVIYETKGMSKSEWLNARKIGIGGSDAASVLGLNPYRSSISVYMDKISAFEPRVGKALHVANDTELAHTFATDLAQNSLIKEEDVKWGFVIEDIQESLNINKKNNLEDTDRKVNYKMELGNKLEDFVAREFVLKTGKKVRNFNGILKNEKYPFAIANIDRAIVGEKAFLECKVTNSFSKREWKEGVPIHYQIQCHHYMAVTGATHCYVAALIGNEELAIHKIDRDEETIKEIMKLEEMFWNQCVLGEELPAPDGSSDYSNVLQDFYKDSKSEDLILFEKDNYLDRYDEVVGLVNELDTEKKAIEQYIKSQMGEYEVAYIGHRKISWKKQSRSVIDSKRLKKEHPELVEEYMKTTTSRVFRI